MKVAKFLRAVIGSLVFSAMCILVMIHGWGFLIIASITAGYFLDKVIVVEI